MGCGSSSPASPVVARPFSTSPVQTSATTANAASSRFSVGGAADPSSGSRTPHAVPVADDLGIVSTAPKTFTSTISLTASLESAELSTDAVKSYHMLVSLKSSAPDPRSGAAITAPRIPVDIICVLDVSGANTPSVDLVSHATKLIRSQLMPADRFAVIIFDSLKYGLHVLCLFNVLICCRCRVTQVHGFLKMSPANKQNSEIALETAVAAENVVDLSQASRLSGNFSSTKMISEALDIALLALQGRKSPNWNTALMLLTDGKDTHQSASSHQKMLVSYLDRNCCLLWSF
jgi:hypothetical protein